MRTVTYNMFDDDVAEEESWNDMPDMPLQKLGSELLNASETEIETVG